MFVGHDRGAVGWAMIASLLETCKLNQVDPLAWTTEVLTSRVTKLARSRQAVMSPTAKNGKPKLNLVWPAVAIYGPAVRRVKGMELIVIARRAPICSGPA